MGHRPAQSLQQLELATEIVEGKSESDNYSKLSLKDIAHCIAVHLESMERKCKLAGRDLPQYYFANAWRAGNKVGIRYISYQGISLLSKEQAVKYLKWLDEGNEGSTTRWSDKMFDVDYTEGIVCPHCGASHEASDYDHGGGVWSCDDCGKDFRYDVNIEVTFSTRCIPSDHSYGDWEFFLGSDVRVCDVCGHTEVKDETL